MKKHGPPPWKMNVVGISSASVPMAATLPAVSATARRKVEPMGTTYRVVEAGATEPEDLEAWLNGEAANGWRCVAVNSMPAHSVTVKTGGSLFRPERDQFRGFVMDGLGSDTFSRTVVYNVWVTLERTT